MNMCGCVRGTIYTHNKLVVTWVEKKPSWNILGCSLISLILAFV